MEKGVVDRQLIVALLVVAGIFLALFLPSNSPTGLQFADLPPVYLEGNFSTVQGSSLVIDLAQYFSDPEGSNLSFAVDDASVVIEGSILTVSPLFVGEHTITVSVSDGVNTVYKPVSVFVSSDDSVAPEQENSFVQEPNENLEPVIPEQNVTEVTNSVEQSVVQRTLSYSISAVPSISQVVLNSSGNHGATLNTSNTSQNLTVFVINATDGDSDPVQNITDWRVNSSSLAVLNLPFESNVSSTASGAVLDYSSFVNNGTLGGGVASQAPLWNSSVGCRVGGCYIFDGVNDFVNVPSSSSVKVTSSYTVSLWTKFGGPGTSGKEYWTLINKNDGSTGFNDPFHIYVLAADANVSARVGTGSTETYLSSMFSINDSSWHHIVLSFDDYQNVLKLFVDGVKRDNQSFTGTLTTSNDAVRLGYWNGYSNFYNGSIDEVQIFNRSLNDSQVYQLYLDGNNSKHLESIVSGELRVSDVWSVAVTPNDNQPNTDGSTVLSNNVTVVSNNVPSIVQVVLNNSNNFGATQNTSTTSQNLTVFVVNASDPDGQSVQNVTDWRVNGSSFAVLNLPFESNVSSNASGAILDYSQFRNNGTLGGGVASQAPLWNSSVGCRVGGCYIFDGVNDFVNVPSSSSVKVTSSYTVSLWTKFGGPGTSGKEYWTLINKNDGSTGFNDPFHIYVLAADANVSARVGTGSTETYLSSMFSINDSSWHHIVLSFDDYQNVLKLFVDGVKRDNQSFTGTLTTSNDAVRLGYWNGYSNFYNGSIDEVQIFNRSLNDSQVYQLYLDGNNSKHLESIVSGELRVSDVWSVAVTPNDNQPNTDGSTVLSNNVTVVSNNVPSIVQVVLNNSNNFGATQNTSTTSQNLTVFVVNASDPDGQSVQNVTDWRVNGSSFAVLNLPFESNVSSNASGAILDYSQFRNNGTLGGGNSSSVPVWNSSAGCKVGGCYVFDGVNDRVNISPSVSLDGINITVVLWIKSPPQSAFANVVDKSHTSADWSGWALEYDSADKLYFWVTNGVIAVTATSTTSLEDNVWHHVAGSYDGANVRIFVDGVIEAAGSLSNGKVNNTRGLFLGMSEFFGRFYNGTMDEVMIFNRNLSTAQINQVYLAGNSSRHLENIVSSELRVGDVWSVAVTPNDNQPNTDGSTVLSNNVTVVSNNVPSIVQVILNSSDGTNRTTQNLSVFVINASDPDGSGVQNVTDWRVNDSSIAVLNMPFESNVSSTATGAILDYSLFRNNGTLGVGATMPVWNSTCKVGGCYLFDGGDRINITSEPGVSNQTLSVGAWVRLASGSQTGRIFVAKYFEAPGRGWGLGISDSSANVVKWFTSTESESTNTLNSTSALSTGVWYHVVGTFDGTTKRLYVNGVLNSSIVWANDIGYTSTLTSIGYLRIISAQHFNGEIDEVQIFNKSLSAAQVYQLYLDGNNSKHLENIVSNELRVSDVWSVAVTPNDNQPNTDGSTVLSNNVTIVSNNVPSIAQVILNNSNNFGATLNTSTTSQNLSVFVINSSDPDGGSVQNITDWRVNGSSFAVLNLPFESNVSSNATGAVLDYSQFRNNGTLGGGAIAIVPVWNSSCRVGGCYRFDSVNDRVQVADSGSVSPTSVMSASAWVRLNTTSVVQCIACKWTNTGNNRAYQFLVGAGNVVLGKSFNGVLDSENVVGATSLVANTWYFLVWSVNSSGNLSVYVNGVLDGVGGSTAGIFDSSNTLQIGAREIDTGSFDLFTNGYIDEFQMYNRSLSSAQIYQLYLDGNTSKHLENIVSNELRVSDVWSVAVTPNDNQPNTDGSTVLSNNVTIVSEAAASTCSNISGVTTLNNSVPSNGTCFMFTANNSVLECSGFSVIGNGTGYGVKITGLSNVSIRNCRFSNFSVGVFVDPENLSIENSTFENMSIGLEIYNTTRSLIQNNTFRNNSVALQINDSLNNVFANLSFVNNSVSISFVNSSLNNFSNTSLTNSSIWVISDSLSNGNILNSTVFVGLNGSINFFSNVTLSNTTNVSVGKLNVSFNNAFLNSTNLSFLNTTAQITLNNVTFTDPRPRVDFEDDGSFANCDSPQCVEDSFTGGRFIFNVSSFTSYSSSEANATTVIAGCPFQINASGTYVVNQSISATANCIVIANNSVNLSCQGNTITWDATGAGNDVAIRAVNQANITIRDCILTDGNSGGALGVGINFTNTSNSTIVNVSISTRGVDGNYGVFLSINSHNNSVSGSVIQTDGSAEENYGVFVSVDSDGNVFENNSIRTNGSSSNNIGIYLFDNVTRSRLVNNSVVTNGTDSDYGIYLHRDSSNNTVENNSISTRGDLGGNIGVVALDLSSSNVVRSNIIATNGSSFSNEGLRIDNSSFNTVENNSIRTGVSGTGSSNRGIIVFNLAANNSILSNTVVTNGTSGNTGFLIFTSNNTYAENNSISAGGSGSSNFGIDIEHSGSSLLVSNRLRNVGTGSYGVFLLNASNNVFNSTILNSTIEWMKSDVDSFNDSFSNTSFLTSNGSIRILGSFNLTGVQEVNRTRLNVSSNSAFLNSTNLTFMNVSAQITLNNVTLTDAQTLVDFEDDGTFVVCDPPQCVEESYSGGRFVFNVSSFTSYSSSEGAITLTLTKSDSQDPINASNLLNYTIIINVTNGTTYNTTLTETYPSRTTLISAQPTPTGSNNTFSLGNLTASTEFRINITVNVSSFIINNTNITNTVNLSYQNSSGSNLSLLLTENTTVLSNITVNSSSGSIAFIFTNSDSPDPVTAGSQLNYTQIINVSSGLASFKVVNSYPSQVSFNSSQPTPDSGSSNQNFTIGNLSSGQLFAVNITVNVNSSAQDALVINNTGRALTTIRVTQSTVAAR